MSALGHLRDTLKSIASDDKEKPFSQREWELVEAIVAQHEIDWEKELKDDPDWWGEDVVKVLKDIGWVE